MNPLYSGAQFVADLKSNITPAVVKFGCYQFVGDAGAEVIAEALAHNTSLQKLDLYRCSINGVGARAIWRALITNSTHIDASLL